MTLERKQPFFTSDRLKAVSACNAVTPAAIPEACGFPDSAFADLGLRAHQRLFIGQLHPDKKKEGLTLNRQCGEGADHDQAVAGTFPKKNSVQNGPADDGIVKKALASMGDEHRILWKALEQLRQGCGFR